MTKKQEATPIDQVEPASVEKAIEKAKKTAQGFAERYQELCKEFGYQIAFAPQWKQSLDTGTFSLVIQPTIVEFKEQTNG